MVSSTPRPHFTAGKDPVPIVQEAGWAPGPVWTGGKSRPHWDSIPDRTARSQSLYRLSYTAHYMYILSETSHGKGKLLIFPKVCSIFFFFLVMKYSCSLTGLCSCVPCRTSLSSRCILLQAHIIHFRRHHLVLFMLHPAPGASGTVLRWRYT